MINEVKIKEHKSINDTSEIIKTHVHKVIYLVMVVCYIPYQFFGKPVNSTIEYISSIPEVKTETIIMLYIIFHTDFFFLNLWPIYSKVKLVHILGGYSSMIWVGTCC